MQLCIWFRPRLQWSVHSGTRMPWTSSTMSEGKFFIENIINYDLLFIYDQWQWLIIKRVNTILNVSSAQNQVAMRKWSAQKIQTKMLLQLNVEKEQVSNAKISDTDRFKNEMYLSVKIWIIFRACILKLDKRAPLEWILWSKRISFPLWLWWPKHNCPYGRNAQLRSHR